MTEICRCEDSKELHDGPNGECRGTRSKPPTAQSVRETPIVCGCVAFRPPIRPPV